MTNQVFTPQSKPNVNEKEAIADFLFEHLDQYGDARTDIIKCMEYAMQESVSPGGYIFAVKDAENYVGVVVVNKTGMSGYIPENILVYIATHGNYRGKGIGKMLMQKTIETVEGDIALHVETNNPAKHLYEKYGFTNPYLEMRLKRNKNTK